MICNAKITSTFLGREDHGIMTFFLNVEMDGAVCGIGGYALDQYDSETKKRICSTHSMEIVALILDVVGVDSWEKLPGKYIRVEENGWGGTIDKIGHIIKDKWVNLREFFESMEKDDKELCKKKVRDCEIKEGDVCKYKHDKENKPFVITKIYKDENGFGQTDLFFDGIYADGYVIDDGTLCAVERVKDKSNRAVELNELLWRI